MTKLSNTVMLCYENAQKKLLPPELLLLAQIYAPNRFRLKHAFTIGLITCLSPNVFTVAVWLGVRKGIRPITKECWVVDGDNWTGALHVL